MARMRLTVLAALVLTMAAGFGVAAPPSAEEALENSRGVAPGFRFLSAEKLQGRVGEALTVTSALPPGVKEADFTLAAQVVSPEEGGGLDVAVEGREVRLKAAKAGTFVVAVVGTRPTRNAM